MDILHDIKTGYISVRMCGLKLRQVNMSLLLIGSQSVPMFGPSVVSCFTI